jgi:8-oxo-dGTP pyrophosphatase MutT (NUDIX family)
VSATGPDASAPAPETPALRHSAVLVPVHRDAAGALRVVLIRRTDHGIHGGQLAFPGGKLDATDASPLEAALRETYEEIGLARDRVRVLETLPDVVTRSTGFRISPFLAAISPPAAWRPDALEVAEVLDLRVDDLVDPRAQLEAVEQMRGWTEPRAYPYIRVGAHRLWGASLRILHPLLPRLVAGEWRLDAPSF